MTSDRLLDVNVWDNCRFGYELDGKFYDHDLRIIADYESYEDIVHCGYHLQVQIEIQKTAVTEGYYCTMESMMVNLTATDENYSILTVPSGTESYPPVELELQLGRVDREDLIIFRSSKADKIKPINSDLKRSCVRGDSASSTKTVYMQENGALSLSSTKGKKRSPRCSNFLFNGFSSIFSTNLVFLSSFTNSEQGEDHLYNLYFYSLLAVSATKRLTHHSCTPFIHGGIGKDDKDDSFTLAMKYLFHPHYILPEILYLSCHGRTPQDLISPVSGIASRDRYVDALSLSSSDGSLIGDFSGSKNITVKWLCENKGIAPSSQAKLVFCDACFGAEGYFRKTAFGFPTGVTYHCKIAPNYGATNALYGQDFFAKVLTRPGGTFLGWNGVCGKECKGNASKLYFKEHAKIGLDIKHPAPGFKYKAQSLNGYNSGHCETDPIGGKIIAIVVPISK